MNDEHVTRRLADAGAAERAEDEVRCQPLVPIDDDDFSTDGCSRAPQAQLVLALEDRHA